MSTLSSINHHPHDPHAKLALPSEINKQLLTDIRGIDYQHPGEIDAVEWVFSHLPKSPTQLALDVGCGRGGTAAYVHAKHYAKVIGLDINPNLVETAIDLFGESENDTLLDNYATEKHQTPLFCAGNITAPPETLTHFSFDIFYLLTAFFLFPNQRSALQTLSTLAAPGAMLAIFDYTDRNDYASIAHRENGELLLPHPMVLSTVDTLFENTGWEITEIIDCSDLFLKWYDELVQKIEAARSRSEAQYGKDLFQIFAARYQHLLDALQSGHLGGALVCARHTYSL